MANQYTLDNDFAAIAEPQGTLYNVGDSAIELADADTTPKGQGILLMTGERRTFTGTLYARSMDAAATLNVSDFTEAGEGGDVGDIRRPSTAYTAGALVDGAGLASGLVLRCTTAGTTSSSALDCTGYGLGDTITDGTVTWLVTEYVTLDEAGGIPTNIYIPGAFNKKETFTTSGSFTAPVTGTYRITLQGGGGGGSCAAQWSSVVTAGGGGGEGGHLEVYEKLIAGTSYSYTVGAGGGGASVTSSTLLNPTHGANGGATSITLSSNAYVCNGGKYGECPNSDGGGNGGLGGTATVNGVTVGRGAPGGNAYALDITSDHKVYLGGNGGGIGGGTGGYTFNTNRSGVFGGGGGGVGYTYNTGTNYGVGGAGGDGYISFEYYDTNA